MMLVTPPVYVLGTTGYVTAVTALLVWTTKEAAEEWRRTHIPAAVLVCLTDREAMDLAFTKCRECGCHAAFVDPKVDDWLHDVVPRALCEL